MTLCDHDDYVKGCAGCFRVGVEQAAEDIESSMAGSRTQVTITGPEKAAVSVYASEEKDAPVVFVVVYTAADGLTLPGHAEAEVERYVAEAYKALSAAWEEHGAESREVACARRLHATRESWRSVTLL